MTKFLKRTVSIFLSFSVLVFRGPTYFGHGPNKQSGSSNSRQIEMEGNTEQSGSSDGQGKSENKVKLSLLSENTSNNSAERAYQFKKIQSSDFSRSTDNTDHSKVVVSIADFFLYPPKSVKDFEPLIKEMINAIKKCKLEDKPSKYCLFLIKPSLEFKKSNDTFDVNIEFNDIDMGSNIIPDRMLPQKAAILVWHLLSSNFPCSKATKAVTDWKVFGEFYEKFCMGFYEEFQKSGSNIDGIIDSIYNQLYENGPARKIILEVCYEAIESEKDEEIKKFIFAILAFCRYAIGEISTLDNFSKVRLCNYFNFTQAVAKAMQQEGNNHEN